MTLYIIIAALIAYAVLLLFTWSVCRSAAVSERYELRPKSEGSNHAR